MARHDAASWRRDMSQYVDDIKDIHEKAAKSASTNFIKSLKQLAPHDTGNLESSFRSEKVEGGYKVSVGGKITTTTVGSRTYVLTGGQRPSGKPTDYAWVQEYGSKVMNIPARAYHAPSRSKVRRAYNRRIRNAVNRLAKKYSQR